MSLWNPYAFTPAGQPMVPAAPPALRVIGDRPATAAQLSAAQAAFAAFCMRARLSAAANPTEIGRLPDGTAYRIVTIGETRIMELQPVGAADERRSGIVIAFGDLDGKPLEGHMTDGESTTYLLTPRVKKRTRDATGEWTVRKLRHPKAGGKAVNADTTGLIYFTGVQGRAEELYPTFVGFYGSVNEYAYAVEARERLGVYRNGSDVGASQHPDSPLPFVLEWDGGKKYAAQLVVRRSPADDRAEVDLLVGPITTKPGEPVGSVVSTVRFPAGTTIQWHRLSIRPDGREARAVSHQGGIACKVDFHITPQALSYTSSGCAPTLGKTTWEYETPINKSSRVDTPGPGGSLHIAQTSETNYNVVEVIGYDGGVPITAIRPRFGMYGTGILTDMGATTPVYAFGPKGQEVDLQVSASVRITKSRQHYNYSEDVFHDSSGSRRSVRTAMESSIRTLDIGIDSELADFIADDANGLVTFEEISSYDFGLSAFTPVSEETVETHSGSGSGRSTTRRAGSISPIYFNRYLEFAIYLDYAPAAIVETWTMTPPTPVKIPASSVTGNDVLTLMVKHKSGVLLRKSLNPKGADRFVAYSASDPMTGALVVNLQQLQIPADERRKRVESWIFVLDGTGVKTIHDLISGLPQNVCVKENRLLYSL